MAPKPRLGPTLLDFALSLPEAYEDHPWGDTVVKVNKRIFVFLGLDDGSQVGVKLPQSAPFALGQGYAEPTGYGLGKHGWVTIHLDGGRRPDTELLTDWIQESYRAVAPKRLVTVLDRRS